MSATSPSSDDYVLDLLTPDGRRRRLGHGDDMKAAYKALRRAAKHYSPYFGLRLRQGVRVLEYRPARPFFAPGTDTKQ